MPLVITRTLPLGLVASVGVAALTGCNPQSAEITAGSFTAMLSLNTSQVFVDDKIRIEDFENSWEIDCRGLSEEDPNRLVNAEDVCLDGGRGLSVGGAPVQHETWVDRDAFIGVHEQLDPWRGEAIMTSEGDLQLTFHHRLPGEDFRFAFVVDPEFQPRECVQDENGNLSQQKIDGDWLDEWTRSMTNPNYDGSTYEFPGYADTGTLFLLNSGAYQFNPDQTTSTWNLAEKYEAGFARARFGPEEMFIQRGLYGRPRAYTAFDLDSRDGPDPADLYFVDANTLGLDQFQGDDFEEKLRANSDFITMMRVPERIAGETQAEFAAMHAGKVDGTMYTPVVPTNAWRRPDESPGGFDKWGEMHYSWVRFDQDRDQLKAGETVSGEFRLYFYGSNSQSHLLVEGSFLAD